MSNRNSKLLLILLFLVSIFIRFSRILPNFEFVTTSLIISSIYLTRKQSLLLILSIMAATDAILGNTNIFLFTWSGFLIPALLIPRLKPYILGLRPIFFGLSTNIFFYIWTNLGVWLLDSWGMYPHTAVGLIQCYINALPFLKTQLESTLVFLPLTLFTVSKITTVAKSHRLVYNP